MNTNAPFRAIGMPTPDRVENLRRAERAAWYAHLEARATVATVPLRDTAVLEFSRERVWRSQQAWAASLLELDLAVLA